MTRDGMMIFAGSASPNLTRNICHYLGVRQNQGEVIRFSEGNLFVRINENVRGRRVYLVQSTGYPVNDNFMELLFWLDAFRRASAESITAVVPYFSYAKGDKKDEPRVAIRARVCADAIESAGADRVITLDIHAPQIQGFFKVPVDDLYALPIFCKAVREMNLPDLMVVSPDAGFAKKARLFASALGCGLAIGDKERAGHDEKAEVLEIIGHVEGKTCLVVDDFSISGGTLCEVAQKLMDKGARAVHVAVTHGIFTGGAMAKIEKSPISSVLVSDSVELDGAVFSPKIKPVSVAPLLGEAIRRIHNRESISVLFKNP
jgi:ribose-phosphate pyrophosphokinase